MNAAYEKKVKQRQKQYDKKLQDAGLAMELETLKSFRAGLWLQMRDINLSIDALDRLIRARRAVAQGKASAI